MQLFKNGYIVQDAGSDRCGMKMPFFAPKGYRGIHRFIMFPLTFCQSDPVCRELSKKQSWRKISDNLFQLLEFISDEELLKQYVEACHGKSIPVRCLYIESDYEDEICQEKPQNIRFIGYEVTEIPFSDMTLCDLAINERFENYRQLLNENGLFANEGDAFKFKTEYKALLEQDLVGDGNVDVFVCAVYETDIK